MNQESFKFNVDHNNLTLADFNSNEMFWIVGLLYEYNKEMIARGTGEPLPYIVISPQLIYANLYDTTKITRRIKESFMKSFSSLISKNMIIILEDKKPAWQTVLKVDVSPLLHGNQNTFVQLSTDDMGVIITRKPSEFSTLLAVYLNIISYINQGHVAYIDQNGFDINTEVIGMTKENQWHISCYASLNRLSTTKHSADIVTEPWISKPTLLKYINILVELGLLQIVKPTVEVDERVTNHYCLPQHREYVQIISNRQAEQLKYKRKQLTADRV